MSEEQTETRRFGTLWVDDAQDRDLDIGTEIRRNRRFVYLQQTREQINEMKSAAEHDRATYLYSDDDWEEYEKYLINLGKAANRVLTVLGNRPIPISEGDTTT